MKVIVSFIPLLLYPRGSSFMVPIAWAPESVWILEEEINFLTLPGIEPPGSSSKHCQKCPILPSQKKDNSVNRLSK
jgi:hypothetical protein